MKKTIKIILFLLAAVAVLVVGGCLIAGNMGKAVHLIQFERQVTLTDGVADPAKTEVFFTIDKGMEYIVEIEWEVSRPGILNGIRISNEQGETVYACTGDWATIEMTPKYLEAGEYLLEAYYLTSEKDFVEFCIMTGLVYDTIDKDIDMSNAKYEPLESIEEAQYEYATEGQWDIKYELKIRENGSAIMIIRIAVIVGVVLGLLLVVIMLASTKTNNTLKGNYDERQEIVRGKGFKYGFFTILICNVWFALTDTIEILQFAEPAAAMGLSVIVGVLVSACYCIWNDGYFALNENRKALLICFAVLGIVNISLGIINLRTGNGFVNGSLTIRGLNLFCGIMFLIVFAVIACKKIKDRGED